MRLSLPRITSGSIDDVARQGSAERRAGRIAGRAGSSKIDLHAVTLRPPTYQRTAIGVRESIGRMISIRQQQVATASPVSARRHPQSASTAAPASASPNPSPHLPSAR